MARMTSNRCSQILRHARANIRSAGFNVAGQVRNAAMAGSFVLGIGAGHDDLAATKLERKLAAGIGPKCLPGWTWAA